MELHDNDVNLQPEAEVTNLNPADQPVGNAVSEIEVIEEPERPTAPQLLDSLREILAKADQDGVDAETVARIKQQFYSIHNEQLYLARQQFIAEGNDPETFVPQPDPYEEEFKQLIAQVKERRAEIRQKIEAEQLRNLETKQAIIAELRQMGEDTDNVNRHYPRAKELQTQFKETGEVPQQNATEIWKAFQEAVEHFYDQWKVNKELRDYDFKKNLSEKQLLVDQANQLKDEPDPVTAFKRLQELHDKWRETGPVDKEHRETIWAEFKDASAEINKRYQAYFEERKQREQQNEDAKTALCEKIEAIDPSTLTSYSAWNKATKDIIQAQEDWKKLGFASRKSNNALFARFRQTCDNFFAAKAAFFAETKDEMSRNLQAKTELCEKAEALMDSTDWKATTQKMVDLQKQWKQIGAVQKKYSDQIWTRFLAACDHFFEQKKHATSDQRRSERDNLATKRQIVSQLQAMNAPEAELSRDEAVKKVNELRQQWQQTGHVPFREKDQLHETYREVVRQLFDKYDINGNASRQASFANNLEEISSDKNRLSRERERLVRVYENRRAELQTYENNLGFFNSRSKAGDSMLRDLQGKIQRIRNDIADLEKKISLIDEKL